MSKDVHTADIGYRTLVARSALESRAVFTRGDLCWCGGVCAALPTIVATTLPRRRLCPVTSCHLAHTGALSRHNDQNARTILDFFIPLISPDWLATLRSVYNVTV